MKTTVYLDTANMFHGVKKHHQRRIDYRKVAEWAKTNWGNDVELRAYCTFHRKETSTTLQKKANYSAFLQVLSDIGYATNFKMSDEYLPRVSWTSQITLDAVYDRSPHVVFFSGDYDLIDLYSFLRKERNVKITVVATQVGLAIQHVIDEFIVFPAELIDDTEVISNDRP